MVNKNMTSCSLSNKKVNYNNKILKQYTKNKNLKQNINSTILKKKYKLEKKDVINITNKIENINISEEKYKNVMVVVPIYLDKKDDKYFSTLKSIKYGLYSIFIVLKDNRELELFDFKEVTHETISNYYPEILPSNINEIKYGVLSNGLKIYSVILNNYLPSIKLQLISINEKYTWHQFNAIIDIKLIKHKESILDFLIRMFHLKYNYDLLSIKINLIKKENLEIGKNNIIKDDMDDLVTQLSALTVIQLKDKLRKNGLKVSGNKRDLVSRIIDNKSYNNIKSDNLDICSTKPDENKIYQKSDSHNMVLSDSTIKKNTYINNKFGNITFFDIIKIINDK